MQATASTSRVGKKAAQWRETVLVLSPFGGLFGIIIAAHIYQPLDHDYFYIAGIVLCFLPLGILSYVRQRAKRHHARPPKVSPYLFLGCPLVFAILLANGALDLSRPEQKIVLVSRKYVVHGKSTSYVVVFPSWRKSGMEKIDVSGTTFSTIRAGKPITMEVHRGLLGFTWVSAVHGVPPNSSDW